MMIGDVLDTRLGRIDELLTVIEECESHLDVALQLSREQVRLPSIVPSGAPVGSGEASRGRPVSGSDEIEGDTPGARIKSARIARGWRQQDLSALTGIARPNIARLESGRRNPSLTTLRRIARAFGLSVTSFLDW